jgi:Zn ribbon nucleic-acid-binding protein
MSAPLPEYNEHNTCLKCGHDKISTIYMPENKDQWIRASYYATPAEKEGRENLRRVCQRCGYQWNEAPLDSNAEIDAVGAALAEHVSDTHEPFL